MISSRAGFAMAILTLSACGATGPGPHGPTPTRGFLMGFSAFPPRPDQAIAVAALQLWSRRADVAIVHEELPWTRLLAGETPDAILAPEKDGLIDFYRGKGFKLVFIADATDGLGREREAPQLRLAGRSIAEPAVQRLYRDWIMAFVRRYRPEYVGLAAETNLIRLLAAPPVYQAVVAVANASAADLTALASPPRLFVSVQVETAWGRLGEARAYRGVEQDFVDFPFVHLLGLSSYPYFGWDDPDQLPGDYYSRLLGGRSLPVMVVEGSWASESAAGFQSTPATQVRYLRRQANLLGAISTVAWISLAPTDIDAAAFSSDLEAAIRPFSRLGVLTIDLAPKPSLAVWDSLFAVPKP